VKISLVKIRNILGITALDFKPGKFTEISGANGTNKTSILDAIKSVMSAGAHDATLLHKGAKGGEVVLVLDDGTELIKEVKETGSKFKMMHGDTVIPRPAETIRGLTDLISINPIDFLLAPKADRVKTLLQAMPIAVDVERLQKISGMGPAPFPPGTHGLKIVDDFRKRVFEERTGVNRVHDEKLATVKQLAQAMPDAPVQQIAGSEEELMTQLERAESAADADLAEVDSKLSSWLVKQQGAGEALKLEAANHVEELKARIAEIAATRDANINKMDAQTVGVKQRANDKKNEIRERLATQSRPIESTLDLLRQNRTNVAKREQAQQTIDGMDKDVGILRERSEWLTAALTEVDQYKLELLAALPIPGLEVRGDAEILRDGIPLDRLNTAQQTAIAIEVAKLRAGKLGFICLDGLEHLDSETYHVFQEQAVQSGLQFFVSRVGDGELSITPTN
jgi:archaellum component FlaC